ncbi:hypothetical protein [Pseudodesulfovibrio sp. S3]|uniref:hypothetical protein n=1 Tax=Pseudodesulfovibrio sp. S3 TaxID=2283629 RepID=UPI0019D41F41|nr:hypothetical protein [Pseudodesulfovibrio sp. S3]MCJ2165494.1 hypothetical protein [Pseudodesulfovibrio sp. S3-i]
MLILKRLGQYPVFSKIRSTVAVLSVVFMKLVTSSPNQSCMVLVMLSGFPASEKRVCAYLFDSNMLPSWDKRIAGMGMLLKIALLLGMRFPYRQE